MPVNPDPGQGFDLKHRIVGALLLIVAAVAILSLVLSDGDQSQRPPADLVDSLQPLPDDLDRGSFVSTVTPLDQAGRQPADPPPADPPLAQPTPLEDAVSETDTDTAEVDPVQEPTEAEPAAEPEPVVEPEPAPEPAPEPETEAPAVAEPADEPADEPARVASADPAAPDVGWVVRVGTFANPENATRLSTLLSDNGFIPRTTEIETQTGKATRVWVGPVETRVEAARLRSELEQITGEEGLITAYP